MAATLQSILDTDSEDEMPYGWEERVSTEGKVYYANHDTKETQWLHPTTGKQKSVAGVELPFGWERCISEDGTVFFVDHNSQHTTYTDPRIAFAREMKESPLDFRQKFDSSSTALHVLHGRDLSDKHVIVTGANSGIGFETARSLALHGASVVMACRDVRAAREKRAAILKEMPKAKVQVMPLDLASLHSVHQFALSYEETGRPLHVLILNAGVFAVPWQETEDGVERTFQVNHLAHLYLAVLLQHLLVNSAPSRLVITACESHRFSKLTKESVNLATLSPPRALYHDLQAYNTSKLCLLLLALSLHQRLAPRGVTVLALHPGNMMSSGIARHCWFYRLLFTLVRPFTKSMEQGASTTVLCATSPDLEGLGGCYFNNCCRCHPSPSATDPELAETLWQFCLKLLQGKVGEFSA